MAIGDIVLGLSTGLAAGSVLLVSPSAGDRWQIYHVTSSLLVGTSNFGVPHVSVGFSNGSSHAYWLMPPSIPNTFGPPIWAREWGLIISDTLAIKNENGSAADILYYANVMANATAGGSLTTVYGLTTSVAQGSFVTIQPGAGAHWLITAVGSSSSNNAVGSGNPDIHVWYYDGTNSSKARDAGGGNQWLRQEKFAINNTDYLRLEQRAASAQNVAYSGVVLPSGVTAVTDISSISAGATWTVAIPASQEWVLFEMVSDQQFGSSNGNEYFLDAQVSSDTTTFNNNYRVYRDTSFGQLWKFKDMKFRMNDQHQFHMVNTSGSTAKLAYSALRTK